MSNEEKKSEFSIIIFIILLILCWPLALIYAVYKHFKGAAK